MTRENLEGVSRETADLLSTYVEILLKWNRKINLIGRTTTQDIWHRHIADSAQLSSLVPSASSWIDLGSGAGLPALVVAALKQVSTPDFRMTVVESDQRKCAFMAEASRQMGISVTILNTRIEQVEPKPYDVISARALAPLDKLLSFAEPFTHSETVCLFPKGVKADRELTDAEKHWHMTVEKLPSATDDASAILRIGAFHRVS